ncbi:MAG TPA: hypothetical protein VD963_05785 [Phycisphaerales bacterium]|nr:hypothetical protein [Phycisphaerales bacterium]
MNQATITQEFGGIIRRELDIESLLRATLEFILSRSGPTNAAVFLPTTSGDFTLGAYVNYDCPRDTADLLLDHLAGAVAPRLENATGILHLPTREAVASHLGDNAVWLGESGVVAAACRARPGQSDPKPECLAVLMLFRDVASQFPAGLLRELRTVTQLFAEQLARVVRIHHRHLPRDQWGALGDGESDEADGPDKAC